MSALGKEGYIFLDSARAGNFETQLGYLKRATVTIISSI